MTVAFKNYEFSYLKNGKYVFCPAKETRLKAEKLKTRIENSYDIPEYYFHYRANGHIAAIHSHRGQRYFAKIDIQNYFYSISRNRVQKALEKANIHNARNLAKWSCVKNPLCTPSYAIPYGFIQSSAIASLVMFQSKIQDVLQDITKRNTVAVYVDDISLSGNDIQSLTVDYESLCKAVRDEGFELNFIKSLAPRSLIGIFNCNLEQGFATVSSARKEKFYSSSRTDMSEEAFLNYCERVSEGNIGK